MSCPDCRLHGQCVCSNILHAVGFVFNLIWTNVQELRPTLLCFFSYEQGAAANMNANTGTGPGSDTTSPDAIINVNVNTAHVNVNDNVNDHNNDKD